jgi:WD40 repeat protein/tetratricopeptide (TPR) repeat protein
VENRPIHSRPIATWERLWRWCKRNPGLATANIAAAILTTILAIGSTIAAWIYRGQLTQTQKAERQAQVALGNSLVAEGAALQHTGLIGQRFTSLDRLRHAAQILRGDPAGRNRLPEIRNQAIAAMGLTDIRLLRERDLGDAQFSVDAALERYAVMEPSGEAVVRRLDDDRELVRLPAPDRRDFWYATCEFSPDGELLVARYGVWDVGEVARIWHLGRRELLLSLSPSLGPAFHPDGRHVAYRAPEGGIAIWDRVERRVVRGLLSDLTPGSLTGGPLHLAFDPEGRLLAVNNGDPKAPRVMIVEFETGRVLADWTSQVGFGGLGWSADGQLLAVGSQYDDPRVYVWNVRRKTLSSVLQGHTHLIGGARFARMGYLLATVSEDETTRLWDAASGEHLLTVPGHFKELSPDDRRLAMDNDAKMSIWELAAGTECRTLHPAMLGNRTDPRDANVGGSADFSPDGRLLATSGDAVRLWEVDTGRELAHLESSDCGDVLFHPDGQSVITAGKWGLYRWPIRPDPDRGEDAIRVGPPELLRESEDVNSAAWLPDHRTLAFSDNAGARVWLIDSSHPHPAWSRAAALDAGDNHFLCSVAVSPDGRWLAAGGWKFAGIRVWDLRRGRLERILRPTKSRSAFVLQAGFSPDGRWLISCAHSDKHPYHFWRVGTWNLDRRIDQERNGQAEDPPVFTADGRVMALGIAPDQVLLADAASGRELARLTTLQPSIPTPLVFSRDGTKLIAGTRQKTVLVWDLRRIREQLAPMGLDWEAPPYPAAPAASETPRRLPPPRPVRVIGEVIETQARRAGEVAEMNRRIAVNPDDADALIHRGWLFLQEKKWPQAINDLERRLRLQPADADACWLLAEAYQGVGNPAGALAVFTRRLERAPEDRDARFQRGRIALAVAQPDLAMADFTRILTTEPDREHARCYRAQALIRLRRHRDALADLDMLLAQEANDDTLYQYHLRSIVHEALGDREQARADRDKASTLLPTDGSTLNERAWILATGSIDRRDPEQAVMLARRSVELAPGHQNSLNTLGVALYRVGEYAESVSVLEQSLAAGKGESAAFDLFLLAMAHHRLAHPAEARDCFDRAVRWWDAHKNLPAQNFQELTSFRAEAEAVLALAGPRAELPADVFAPE